MSDYYLSVLESQGLGQGDIFKHLPFFDLKSNEVINIVPENTGSVKLSRDLASYVPDQNGELTNVLADIIFRPGIIITQNCDVLRSEYVSFCELRPYTDFEKDFEKQTTDIKKVNFLTKNFRNKDKFFYLLFDESVFQERMAIDFSRIYQIRRELLETMKNKRLAHLGTVPLEHFRIKIANYFKRYAYDEWYILNRSEFGEYYTDKQAQTTKGDILQKDLDLIEPFGWQT